MSLKQQEVKFYPHRAGRQQQSITYDTVKDHIMQYVQKTYKNGQDIAVSLRDLQKKDLEPERPKRGVATETDEKVAKINQDGLDIIYQVEITKFLERKEMLD